LATSYNNVGAAYHALGDAKQGLEYINKGLEIRRIIKLTS